ncbi:aquaporin Z [Lujinxingia litoralis]|uniref:Aquaporin Z n=1 Tax=Lujinxingia litoralis TaxID=2211119 RepID=A0A328C9S7_9DELT|nr:aquaporin Z [Lujinxingia litoralis]RAL25387.1 aquaporin Z [Lujinxingia litoralis]
MQDRARRLSAEFVGTFFLVLVGCGAAVIAATFPEIGVGIVGVGLAFGLTLLVLAYAIGDISGCHINPAVSLGLWIGGRFPGRDVIPYIVVQVLGGVAAAAVLYVVASGSPTFSLEAGFAANGYGEHSPGGYTLLSGLVIEVLMTGLFVFAIMGATHKRVPAAVAPLAIGLALMLVHLISLPVTNTSVNPARSTGVALFVGGWALSQLWLFWLAPIAGGVGGALLYRALGEKSEAPEPEAAPAEFEPDFGDISAASPG